MADPRDTTFVVLYRIGGWASCRWQRVLEHYSEAEAQAKVEELTKAGYKALHRSVAEHDVIGAPIGWDHRLVDHEVDAITVTRTATIHTVHHSRYLEVQELVDRERIA